MTQTTRIPPIRKMTISLRRTGINDLMEEFIERWNYRQTGEAMNNVKKSITETLGLRVFEQFPIIIQWVAEDEKNAVPTAELEVVFPPVQLVQMTPDTFSEVYAKSKQNQNTMKSLRGIVQQCLKSSTDSFLNQLKIIKLVDGTEYPDAVHNIENLSLLKKNFPAKPQKLSKIIADHMKDAKIIRKSQGGFNYVYIYDNNRIVRISKNGSTTKGFSEDELITANNWKKAAMHSITPRIFWQGYVNIDDKKKRDFPHFAVIMEAYDTNMKEFVEQNLHKPKGRQIVHDLVKKVTKKTWDLTTLLRIGCIDTKPENIVVRSLPDDQIDVRLIDLEGDLCKRNNTDNQVALRGNTYGAFVVSICLLAIHCIGRFNENLFWPVMNNLKSKTHTDEYLPNNVPHISLTQIKRAYNNLQTREIVSHYFDIDTFEDFWFLSNHPWPSSNTDRAKELVKGIFMRWGKPVHVRALDNRRTFI